MVLNSKISYDKLSEKIGERLEVEPTHLRFYTINASSGNPRNAVKRGSNQTLGGILNPAGYSQLNMNQRNDELFFEVLDMSLAELETKKGIKVTLLSEGITKEVSRDSLRNFNHLPVLISKCLGSIRPSCAQERPSGRPH
jgi:ubiquitin carboxyl-terminal hydrolase 7